MALHKNFGALYKIRVVSLFVLLSSMSQSGFVFKIIVVGNYSVGKTSILQAFMQEKKCTHVIVTVGASFPIKRITVDGIQVELQLWDTAGQERYMVMAPLFYKKAHGCLIVYDVTNKQSFSNVASWLQQQEGNNIAQKILVGNKIDLKSARQVEYAEGKLFAEENAMQFIETSAFEYTNIPTLFSNLVKKIIENYEAPEIQPPLRIQEVNIGGGTCYYC